MGGRDADTDDYSVCVVSIMRIVHVHSAAERGDVSSKWPSIPFIRFLLSLPIHCTTKIITNYSSAINRVWDICCNMVYGRGQRCHHVLFAARDETASCSHHTQLGQERADPDCHWRQRHQTNDEYFHNGGISRRYGGSGRGEVRGLGLDR